MTLHSYSVIFTGLFFVGFEESGDKEHANKEYGVYVSISPRWFYWSCVLTRRKNALRYVCSEFIYIYTLTTYNMNHYFNDSIIYS